MTKTLHIIEPTLRDQTGHCYSFVQSILRAGAERPVALHVWTRRDSTAPLEETSSLRVHRHFGGAPRRLQSWSLCRRLLRTEDRVFLSTATRTDLAILGAAAAPSRIEQCGRVFAYVHWMRPSARRVRALARIARRHPGLELLCPTESVEDVLREAGFEHVRRVPYPRSAASPAREAPSPSSGLLYAGAARADKGFAAVVDLVALLQREARTLPVTVQSSPTHKGRHDGTMTAEIERLRAVGYAPLRLVETTLAEDAYRELFAGAITLQPYDPADFADRVSGVTLDALEAGSPVIVPAGTWMARQAVRFDAGVAVGDTGSAQALLEAADAIVAAWPRYAAGAAAAGRALAVEHDGRRLLEILLADPADRR